MLSIKRTTFAAALGLAPVYLFGCASKKPQGDGQQSGGMDENMEFDPDCDQAKDMILGHIRELWYGSYCCDVSKKCVDDFNKDDPKEWQNNKFIEDVWAATKQELKATDKPCTMANVKAIIQKIYDCELTGRKFWDEKMQEMSFNIRVYPAFCAIKSQIKAACEKRGLPCDGAAVDDVFKTVAARLKEKYGKEKVAKILKEWEAKDDNGDMLADIPEVVQQEIDAVLNERN